MVFLEAAVVLGTLGLLVYWILMLLDRPGGTAQSVATGHWRTTHYDAQGRTRVVLQKVSSGGVNVLDEHVVDSIPIDDPAYEDRFLTAMATARERRALFEAEED